jgi:hypothetical protein
MVLSNFHFSTPPKIPKIKKPTNKNNIRIGGEEVDIDNKEGTTNSTTLNIPFDPTYGQSIRNTTVHVRPDDYFVFGNLGFAEDDITDIDRSAKTIDISIDISAGAGKIIEINQDTLFTPSITIFSVYTKNDFSGDTTTLNKKSLASINVNPFLISNTIDYKNTSIGLETLILPKQNFSRDKTYFYKFTETAVRNTGSIRYERPIADTNGIEFTPSITLSHTFPYTGKLANKLDDDTDGTLERKNKSETNITLDYTISNNINNSLSVYYEKTIKNNNAVLTASDGGTTVYPDKKDKYGMKANFYFTF